MSTPPIITKDTVSRMVSLLDWCYRLGVQSAYELQEDEGLIREFLERTSQPGVYGFLTETPIYIDWQEWTLRLMAKARLTSWNGSMAKFFDRMGRFGSNYLSVFLPLSQVFHNKGIRDFMAAPMAADINALPAKHRSWWTPKGLRTISNTEWVSELRMVCYDLERRDTPLWQSLTPAYAKKVALKPKHYEMFRRCVVLVMMRDKY